MCRHTGALRAPTRSPMVVPEATARAPTRSPAEATAAPAVAGTDDAANAAALPQKLASGWGCLQPKSSADYDMAARSLVRSRLKGGLGMPKGGSFSASGKVVRNPPPQPARSNAVEPSSQASDAILRICGLAADALCCRAFHDPNHASSRST